MADNRKYYYLKLKEDFFDSDELKILESQKDGYLYSKRSISNEYRKEQKRGNHKESQGKPG